MLENINMVFDFPCSELFYETFEEIREIGVCIENLLENSVDDVVWCLRQTLDFEDIRIQKSFKGFQTLVLNPSIFFIRLRLFGGRMIMDHNENKFIESDLNFIFYDQEYIHTDMGEWCRLCLSIIADESLQHSWLRFLILHSVRRIDYESWVISEA